MYKSLWNTSHRSCQITKEMRLTVRKFKVYQTSGVPLHRDQSPPLTGLISVLTGCGSNFNLQTFSLSLSLYSVQCFLYPDCRSSLSSLYSPPSFGDHLVWLGLHCLLAPQTHCTQPSIHAHTHTHRGTFVCSAPSSHVVHIASSCVSIMNWRNPHVGLEPGHYGFPD